MAKQKTVTEFKKDHWYRYTVKHKSTPSGWNTKMMDVCDGKPCLCIYGDGYYAEFKGHKHFDSDEGITDETILKGARTRGWAWDSFMENWEEVKHPSGFDAITDPYSKYSCDEPDCEKVEDDTPKYSFKLPKRSDLRAELLEKLS